MKRVELEDRSTVVLALRGYAESLRMEPTILEKMGLSRLIKPREEIARAEKLTREFANKFLYLSDEMINETQLFLSTVAYTALLAELSDLVSRELTVTHKPTAESDSEIMAGVPDPDAVSRIREIVAALAHGVTKS